MPASAVSSIASRVAAAERGALARALHLDERAGVGRDDVRVDLGPRVLLVGQVQPHPPVDHARRSPPRPGTTAASGPTSRPCAPSQVTASASATYAPVIAAVRVPPSACRTSQSSAMVFSPSALRSMHARSARPTSREISCVRPPTRPLTDSRSLRVLRRRRQHRVLGGQPAQPRALAPARHALGDARRAQHLRVAERDQHRACRVLLEAAGDRHGAELVVGSAVCAGHRDRLWGLLRRRTWRPAPPARPARRRPPWPRRAAPGRRTTRARG